ncbi:MAG: phosphatase PAP2 family protein [Solirubrobacterales bacterium]|nr:phosphatase PAP2 family protein [Solirubrobacterales bacterium]
MMAGAAATPGAAYVLMRPSKTRQVVVCALQMWAYLAAYELPYDDPEALAERVHISYPIDVDRVLGLGKVPSERLQRMFARDGQISHFERMLVWSHWVWFPVPHLSVLYVLWRRPERFSVAAARLYLTYDLGAVVYWALPTAPPWWAAWKGYLGPEDPLPIRRLMQEYGEEFWGERWAVLFDALGGNPLAAMPSMHFATSIMAARALAEAGPVAGAIGWTYASTLGVALVYLGEHYVLDLIAGASLAEAVLRGGRRFAKPIRTVVRGLDALARVAAKR